MCAIYKLVFVFLIASFINLSIGINTTNADSEEIWGPLLEDWATSSKRVGRVMQIPLTPTAYVEEKMINDSGLEKESKITVNNKPKPPGRVISETDLYLLGAMEKLVYRLDFMEKRLRRVEEMLYFVMAGNRIDVQADPCPTNYQRVAKICYLFLTAREYDWKAASKLCKKEGGILAEIESIEENQDIIAHIQSTEYLRGRDFWTGALNPGLLWIWSNSARPVSILGNQNNKNTIVGNGRCLRLAYDPALRSYSYKGTECSLKKNIICEIPEDTSSNEIKRIGRERKIFDEL